MAGTPASPVGVQLNHSSLSLDEPSTVQNANLSDTMAGYAFGADMMVDSAFLVDPLDSIFSEKMPVVEDISSQALSWLQDNTPAAFDLGKDTYVNVPSISSANIDGDANLSDTMAGHAFGVDAMVMYILREGLRILQDRSWAACGASSAVPWLQKNTPPSVFAAAPRNLASFEQEGFNQDFAGVANEGKAEKLCVKRQGRKRPNVNTTNGDIMSQLTDMRTEKEELKKMLRQMGDQLNEGKTENEKLKKEVEEMQNRLIKMDGKQNHKFKTFEELLLKMFDKMKQMAVCNKAEKLCVKRQGGKRPTVNTTNGDIMSQLTDMRTENEELKKMLCQMGDQLNEGKTENEKLKKEVEEMQNRLIKMDGKQNHKFKTFEELLLKMLDKMKQMAVCNNKGHCCSAE